MTYGHASPDEPVQIVNLRVAAVGKLGVLDLWRSAVALPESAATLPSREAYFKETGLVRTAVLHRDALTHGDSGTGPVIIESADTTIVVPPGWQWRADEGGFIILEVVHG
jgi:N-methylhydantoinase A